MFGKYRQLILEYFAIDLRIEDIMKSLTFKDFFL